MQDMVGTLQQTEWQAVGLQSEMDGKYLTFFTDNQLYGVPIADVLQIVGLQQITAIPEFPDYAKGIINLRGTIIPVIDIRLRIGKPEMEYNERTCIIITMIGELSVGLLVDAVDGVTTVDEDSISPPPQLSGDQSSRYVTGIGKLAQKVVLLLDIQKIINDSQFSSLAQAVTD